MTKLPIIRAVCAFANDFENLGGRLCGRSTLAEDAPGLSVEALARQMNVAGGPTESPWPKKVGLLFFNETPERFFPGVQIDVVWFPEGAAARHHRGHGLAPERVLWHRCAKLD
jgi:hypothetical protein